MTTGFSLVCGVALADFLSGIFHWFEDRYGKEEWPIVGRLVIEPNIRHHYSPLDFTRCSYLKRNRAVLVLCAISIGGAYIASGFRCPPVPVVVALCVVSQANETHRWAHLPASQVPRPVRVLQASGLFLSTAHHRVHHTKPFDRNFCTITNFVNPVLEAVRFFPMLEWIVWVVCGALPRQDDGKRPTVTRAPTLANAR